jgi:hypothetical protein
MFFKVKITLSLVPALHTATYVCTSRTSRQQRSRGRKCRV